MSGDCSPDAKRSNTAVRDMRSGSAEFGPPDLGSVRFIVGGSYNNGQFIPGVATYSANNDLGNSNDNIGARLAYPSVQYINDVTLGTDHASRQKMTETNHHSAGRRAYGYARPKVGPEVDRTFRGVCP